MRDQSVDILRCVAIICIVVSHIDLSAEWIINLRSFDVPLIVFLSGVAFSLSKSSRNDYPEYIASRFIRLIVPTWIFLSFFFVVRYLIDGTIPDYKTAIKSFLLLTNWYTWIIRVLFIVAIIAPLTLPALKRMTGRGKFLALFAALFVNEVFAITLCKGYNSFDYRVMLAMILPYTLIFLMGASMKDIPKKDSDLAAVVFGALFLVCLGGSLFIKGSVLSLPLYKYPPRFYWLAYGLACSLILWHYKEQLSAFLEKVFLASFASFVGSHTLWVYFWHIIIISFFPRISDLDSAFLRFILVISPSVVFTYIQSKIAVSLARKIPESFGKRFLYVFNG